jgi:hypothetical protein
MKTSELIEQLIWLERDSPYGDLDVRCSDRSKGVQLFPIAVEIVQIEVGGKRFFSLEC